MKIHPFPQVAGPRRSAFSLMETLVVLTIVAILVAVLLPAYRAVKQKSNTIKCMNNMREIGSGMMLYAADTGHFPHSSHIKLWADWGEFLIPYMDRLTENNKWVPGETWAGGLYKLNGTFNHLAHEYGQGSKNRITGQVYFQGYSWFTCPVAPASNEQYYWQNNPAYPAVHIYAHTYAANEYLMPYGRWINAPYTYGPADTVANENLAMNDYAAGKYVPFPPVKPSQLERPGSLILLCDAGVQITTKEASDTLYGPLYMTYQPGSPDNPSGVIMGGIVDDFVNNADASTRGDLPVITPPSCDNDDGTGIGWPVYYRHNGNCVALMADGHVQLFKNGEMKRRNFVSHGKTRRWGFAHGEYAEYIEAYYP